MHTHTHTPAVAEQFQAFTRPQLSKQHLNCPLMTSSTSLVGQQKHPSVLLSVGEEHASTPPTHKHRSADESTSTWRRQHSYEH